MSFVADVIPALTPDPGRSVKRGMQCELERIYLARVVLTTLRAWTRV